MNQNPKIIDDVRLIQKCLIVGSDGKILALKRSADDHSRSGCWDLPGGGYEQGEDVVGSIKREVKEEAGLVAHIVTPIYVSNRLNIKTGLFAGLNVFSICYVCRDWQGEVKLSDEHTEYQWVTPETFMSFDFGEDGGFFVDSTQAYTSLPH